MEVVWSKTALNGIARAYRYLHELNPRAAEELASALFAAGESLCEFPHRGRPVLGTAMRELVAVGAYIVRYRVAGDTVRILRVRHGAMRPTEP